MAKEPLNLRLNIPMLQECTIYGFEKCIGRKFTSNNLKYMALRIHRRLAYKTGKRLGVEVEFDPETDDIKFTFESPTYSGFLSCNLNDYTKTPII